MGIRLSFSQHLKIRKMCSAKALLLLLLIQNLSSILSYEQIKRFDGFKVFRITPETDEHLNYLRELSENNFEIDFWTYPSTVNRSVDLMISPELKEDYERIFSQKYYSLKTLISDVGALIEDQRLKELKRRDEAIPGFWDAYQTYPRVLEFIDAIVAQNPQIASQQSIGKSTENRDLRLLKLGINSSGNVKPIIFIDSTVHAREWITTSTTTWFIQQLCDGYTQNNAAIIKLLTDFDFYIIPVMNPDGYVFTQTNRMWRKTRSANPGSTCIGTDPNRNFNHNWTVIGSSTNPCSETYAGSKPFSEPETKALSDLILGIKERVKLYLAMHSYSQLLLSPWGYTTDLPANNNQIVAKSNIFVDTIKQDYGTIYKAGSAANILYANSGSARDWAHGVAGIPYSFTLELRDTGNYGFILPVDQIKPSGIETTRALIALIQSIGDSL